MRPFPLRAAGLLAIGLLTTGLPPGTQRNARADDSSLWLSVRSGGMFYNVTDPDDLESLATVFSIRTNEGIGTSREVQFEDKGWEIPLTLRLGLDTGAFAIYGMYERLPYILDNSADRSQLFAHPNETLRLDLPANLWGGGVDFRLGEEGYGAGLRLGLAAGTVRVNGDDLSSNGRTNFTVEGTGFFWEISLAAELEFTDEIRFQPFFAYRSAVVDAVDATFVRSATTLQAPPFEIDYTGVLLGVEARFQLYPWDPPRDPDPTGEQRR